ncbi:ELWxxDGT repeat protein [Luteolibacter soli]|uniref:ELWxxDGT repeat protein n=1 Tax=Luteolibacter soli TaxID=3135280 RepID=A0ABU9AVH5_9BACT
MTSLFKRPALTLPALLASLAFISLAAPTLAQAQEQEPEQTARLIRDINRGMDDLGPPISWVMPLQKSVVLAKFSVDHGLELWTSNGTPTGTRLLKDILPGPDSSFPDYPVAFGSSEGARIAFTSNTDTFATRLWVTDGTSQGTLPIFETSGSGFDHRTRAVKGTPTGVFFESGGTSYEDRYELHFTDGTPAGTWSLNPLEGETRTRFTSPSGYLTSGQWYYFIANKNEIWRSDGTPAGTTNVITITQGTPTHTAIAGGRLFVAITVESGAHELWCCPMDGGPLTLLAAEWDKYQDFWNIVPLGDRIIFHVAPVWSGPGLWTSNGTPEGTRRLPLQDQGSEPQLTGDLTPWNGAVYVATWRDDRSELWKTDGTLAGTSHVITFPPGYYYRSPSQWEPHHAHHDGTHLYLQVQSPDVGWEVWRTRGDTASTVPVPKLPRFNPEERYSGPAPILAVGKNGLFVITQQGSDDEALWRTRGKSGAVRLTRPEKVVGSNFVRSPFGSQPYEMLDGSLLAFVNTGRHYELWRMNPDGTRARSLWKPEAPLAPYNNSEFGFRAIIGDTAVFTFSGADRSQVWATDGTRQGTRLLAEALVGSGNNYPADFVKAGGIWYFTFSSETYGEPAALWKTDGTPAGTSRIVTADGNFATPDTGELVEFHGQLHFLSTGEDNATSIWRSDGTAAGTVPVTDPSGLQNAKDLSAVGDRLLFFADWSNNHYFWQSDGTAQGTVQVLPLQYFASYSTQPPLDLGGVAIFQGTRDYQETQWWRHDAITGTRPVRDPHTGPRVAQWDSGWQNHAIVGNRLFYSATAGDGDNYEYQLWLTDGTSDGTRLVKSFGTSGYLPENLLAVGNLLYFTVYQPAYGRELWRSDGTETGTVLVADIDPGPADSSPFGLKAMDGKLYFGARREDIGYELFVIDLPQP